jgi:FtsZ-binding cell division protein ZapB
VRASAAQINSRVWGLRMGSLKHEGLPQDYVAQVDVDVKLVLQFLTELLGHADKLDAELKKVSNEGDRLRALNDRERKEHAQYQNRVQACITDMEHDMQRNSDRCMTMEGLLASLEAQSLEDQQKLKVCTSNELGCATLVSQR